MGLVQRASAAGARLADRLPWWLAVAAGGLLGIAGAVLVVRPFLSLGALIVVLAIALVLQGAAELLRAERPWTAAAAALAWLAAGVLVLASPALTIGGLTLIVGISLLVGGVLGVVRALRGERDGRVADVLLGLASIALGVLALTWPDVTVLVVAVTVGVRLLLLGVDLVVRGVRRARDRGGDLRADARAGSAADAGAVTGADAPGPVAGRSRWTRTTWAVVALTGCTALLLVSLPLSASPQPDGFYDAPEAVPGSPGQLLRAEPFDRTIPEGARAWRILYTTTARDGAAALASALVVVPDGEGDRPVIAWAHGTTGYATGCAPSLLAEPFVAGAMPDLAATLAEGWAVVATDYAGLGTAGSQPYLIGEGEARSVLDAVRAAQQLTEAPLAAETVLWGHSQGGHAALWSAGLAPSYAPELELLGVAAMAPASDLPDFLGEAAESPLGAVFGSFALAAYAEAYPDVRWDGYVRPGARILLEEMQQRCLTDPGTIVSVVTSITAGGPVWARALDAGALGQRAAENVPTLTIGMPVLLAQGGADTLITPTMQEAYTAARCADGTSIDHRVYDGLDHMGLVTGDSALLPELRAWTAARFAGEPAVSGCR